MLPGTYFLPDLLILRSGILTQVISLLEVNKENEEEKERKKERWPSPSVSGAVLLKPFF
jgi:hypothetical protein